MRQCVLGLLAVVSIAVTVVAQGPTRTKVMLLDGESGGPYHDWPRVTVVLERILGEVGLFEVSVATAPPTGGKT